MLRSMSCVLVLLLASTTVKRAISQEAFWSGESDAVGAVARAERPMSIFNETVRRFRFELEDTLVTAETAAEFMVRYGARKEPSILGAYADPQTNSLVVVGPADAEQSVRETLAKWIVDRHGVTPLPLAAQRRALEFRRRDLLREMADLEILMIPLDANKANQLRERLDAFEVELTTVEKQLAVIERYIERLGVKPITRLQADALGSLAP